jgi:hypothetical protein
MKPPMDSPDHGDAIRSGGQLRSCLGIRHRPALQ